MTAFDEGWGVVKSRRRRYAVPTSPSEWAMRTGENGLPYHPRIRYGRPLFTGPGHPKRAYASSSGRRGWNYGNMPNPPKIVDWDEHHGDIDKLREALAWRNWLQGLADRNEPTIARDSVGYGQGPSEYYHGTECHCASCMSEGGDRWFGGDY